MDKPVQRSLIRPSKDTPFQIDFEWWRSNDNSWQVHLQSCLCAEHQEIMKDLNSATIDYVDPVTAEVAEVDAVQHVLITHCALQPDFITEYTSLVEAVFRTFLANGNTPLSAVQLSERIGKPALTILKTLSGPKVYKGIRPQQ